MARSKRRRSFSANTVVSSGSFGSPPKKLKSEVQTMVFKIYNFEKLEHKRNEFVDTSEAKAFGHEWKIRVYPRGNCDTNKDKEIVSVFLYPGKNAVAGKIPAVKYTFRCKEDSSTPVGIVAFKNRDHGEGYIEYIEREKFISACLDDDGTFKLEVDLQLAVDKEENNVWYPKLDRIPCPNLTELYQSSYDDTISDDSYDSTADIAFKVNGKGTMYYAHKSILSLRARTLYDFAKEHKCSNNDNDKKEQLLVSIDDVDEADFESLLQFVYCVQTPEIKTKTRAKKMLVAADKFGVVDLKLYVESTIVDKYLNSSNAAEWLVISDALSCPLLKESCMKVYASDAAAVRKSKSWSELKESASLLEELLDFCMVRDTAVTPIMADLAPNGQSGASDDKLTTSDIEGMDVTAIRTRLLDANLDIDGNRQILANRLLQYFNSN